MNARPFGVLLFLSIFHMFQGNNILTAILQQNVDEVKNLLKKMEAKDLEVVELIDGTTPLHAAILTGNVKIVKMIIKKGTNVNIQDMQGNTPMHFAAEMGSKEIVEKLEKNHGNVDIMNGLGHTPFLVAMRYGYVDLAQYFMDKNVRMNLRDPHRDGGTFLHHAIDNNAVHLIDKYIKQGGWTKEDIEVETGLGFGPLMAAVESGKEEISRILILAGADVTKVDYRGNTSLHYSAYNRGFQRVTELLVRKGADINARCNNGYTALINTIIFRNQGVFVTLIKAGASVHVCKPLHVAVSVKERFYVNMLLSRGANMYARDKSGATAFQKAVTMGEKRLVAAMIEAGVRVSPQRAIVLLKKFWVSAYGLLMINGIEAYREYDAYILDISNNYLRAANLKWNSIAMTMKLYETLDKHGFFALYRLLRICYGQFDYSLLENKKMLVFHDILRKISRKTYMEKLPVILIADAFWNTNHYVAWRGERLAWFATFVSHIARGDINVAKILANDFFKSDKSFFYS